MLRTKKQYTFYVATSIMIPLGMCWGSLTHFFGTGGFILGCALCVWVISLTYDNTTQLSGG